MPRYATPPIPQQLEALVTLGINRIKIAVLVALSDEGGTATTAQISQAVPSIRTTLLRHLKELESEGYVTADLPMEQWKPGVRVAWTLNPDRLHADLQGLIRRTSPHSDIPAVSFTDEAGQG